MDSKSDPAKLHPIPPKRNRIDRQREESSSSSTPNQELVPLFIDNFPYELVIEILLRLPSKSLVKFKCVSRSWLSVISSQRFIKTHLAIASEREDYRHHSLLFTVIRERHSHLKQCSVNSVLHAPTSATTTTITEVIDIDYPMKGSHKSVLVVGSCNGLVCIGLGRKYLFLWNPCIKKSKKLPDMDPVRTLGFRMFGFGYDKLSDDYKVVAMFSTLDDTAVGVCSLKNNSWNRIEDFKAGFVFGSSGQYASGKLHWAASHGIDNWKIISLDLADETYGEMERPNNEDKLFIDWTLGELGGCLSVLYDCEGRCADVWVMREYGVKDSWSKVVSVSCVDYPRKLGHFTTFCLLRNGEILFVSRSMLLLYSPKSNTFRKYPQVNHLEDVHMYLESLVSPSAYDDGEERQLQ